jgi:hypothetical protein
MVSALCVAAGAAAQPADQKDAGKLMEGFGVLSQVRVSGGRLEAASAGAGVTQGKQAAKLPSGAALTFALPTEDCQKRPWLLVDTLTLEPLVHELRVTGSLGRASESWAAHVRAGKDTLAMPLTALAARFGSEWPEGQQASLVLTNASARAIIVDNVRLAAPLAAPAGSVLLDFGDPRQTVWPGFEAAEAECPHVKWSGEHSIRSGAGPPDALAGDFVGPPLGSRTVDNLTVNPPGSKPAAGWLWVTHYGSGQFQPTEYMLKLRGKVLLHKRLSAREMLGAKGLLEGIDGEWTPEWYNAEYAGHFTERLRLALGRGRNRIDLGNCQLAALAMAPVAQRGALGEYVQKLQQQLRRYRRQFILGHRDPPVCDVSPTEQERRDGAIVFAPPPDEAFQAGFRPREEHRAESLRVTVANGELAVVPLLVAALDKAAFVSASLGSLSDEAGRTLATDRDRGGVLAVRRVPWLRDGRAQFQPWILARRHERVERGELACFALLLAPRSDAKAGTYRGSLQVRLLADRVEIPVEVELAHLGPPEDGQPPTLGLLRYDGGAYWFYHALAAAMPERARLAKSAEIRRQLLSDAFNALWLSCAGPDRGLHVHDSGLRQRLKSQPVALATGRSMLDLGGVYRRLQLAEVAPGTQMFESCVRASMERTAGVVGKAGLQGYQFYLGHAGSPEGIVSLADRAKAARLAGRRTAATVSLSALQETPAEARAQRLTNIHALGLDADGPEVGPLVDWFRGLEGRRSVYVAVDRADRYSAGFFAAGVGAEGAYVFRVAPRYPIHSGHGFDGSGALVPEPDGSFSSTLAMLALRQAASDYRLVGRCRALVERAEKAKVNATTLSTVLEDIRRHARSRGTLYYDRHLLRTPGATVAEMEAWRTKLTEAAAGVAERLAEP